MTRNMSKWNGLWAMAAALLLVSCSMSAKPEHAGDTSVATPAAAEGTGEVVTLTKAEFLKKVFDYEKNPTKWVYAGDKPCIIDFYADWCGPCKRVAPILRELAAEYKQEIIVYKINVDQEKELAAVFGVQSIPTFLFIPKEGQPMVSMGALPREEFVKQIDSFLLKKK